MYSVGNGALESLKTGGPSKPLVAGEQAMHCFDPVPLSYDHSQLCITPMHHMLSRLLIIPIMPKQPERHVLGDGTKCRANQYATAPLIQRLSA